MAETAPDGMAVRPSRSELTAALSREDLTSVFYRKYGPAAELGWGPRLRFKFGYFTPDDIYETLVSALVASGTVWLDVGCGKDIFPDNVPTAELLAQRCGTLVGLDPSDNIQDNQLVHEAHQVPLEDFQPGRRFDLLTLRMVAEHIANPKHALAALAQLANPGGRVVVYTVYKWSPATLISAAIPFRLHHYFKRLLWNTEERDTFPVVYKMNTRNTLKRLFAEAGFEEEKFHYLDDCRSFAKWKLTSMAELSVWKILHAMRLHYPEVSLLGVYRKR